MKNYKKSLIIQKDELEQNAVLFMEDGKTLRIFLKDNTVIDLTYKNIK
jgi:hypothetical protein